MHLFVKIWHRTICRNAYQLKRIFQLSFSFLCLMFLREIFLIWLLSVVLGSSLDSCTSHQGQHLPPPCLITHCKWTPPCPPPVCHNEVKIWPEDSWKILVENKPMIDFYPHCLFIFFINLCSSDRLSFTFLEKSSEMYTLKLASNWLFLNKQQS